MDTELQQDHGAPEFTSDVSYNDAQNMNISIEEAGAITMASENKSADTAAQFEQISEKLSQLLADLPSYVTSFFSEYKRPLTTVGLLLSTIIAAKLTLALLDALDDIPLLAPAFELVGFGYTAWFVYRYLWRASNRQELVSDFNALKDQVVGNRLD